MMKDFYAQNPEIYAIDQKRKRRTRKIILLVLVGCVAFFCLLFFIIGTTMKSSDAYKTAINEIENSREVLAATGGITGYGFMPNGSINYSGSRGDAQLTITVKGKEKDADVYISMETASGKWEVLEMVIE